MDGESVFIGVVAAIVAGAVGCGLFHMNTIRTHANEVSIEIDGNNQPTGTVFADPGYHYVGFSGGAYALVTAPFQHVDTASGIAPGGENLKVQYQTTLANFPADRIPALLKAGVYAPLRRDLSMRDVSSAAARGAVSDWIAQGRPESADIGAAVAGRIAAEITRRGVPTKASDVPPISVSVLSVERVPTVVVEKR